MEVFSNLVDKAASGGFLTGFNIANRQGEEEQITHLLFVDDTLVFCNDTREQLAYLSWVLLWFEAIFGLKINMEKSSILSVGIVENLEYLAFELGCRKGNSPTTYLGLPLGMKCKSIQVWDEVEERFRKKVGALEKTIHIKRGKTDFD